jgi:hypothetical protein
VPEALARLTSAASLIWGKKAVITEMPQHGKTLRNFARIAVATRVEVGSFLTGFTIYGKAFLKMNSHYSKP